MCNPLGLNGPFVGMYVHTVNSHPYRRRQIGRTNNFFSRNITAYVLYRKHVIPTSTNHHKFKCLERLFGLGRFASVFRWYDWVAFFCINPWNLLACSENTSERANVWMTIFGPSSIEFEDLVFATSRKREETADLT